MNKIAITCGDPAGIGPEIIYDWWRTSFHERANVVLIGPKKWLKQFDGGESWQFISVGNEDFDFKSGMPTEEGAQIALEALELARAGCYNKEYAGVVTGPISKEWMNRVGFMHPGQTEFFGEFCDDTPVMGFVGEKMIVTLATSHIPLSEVPKRLNEKVLFRAIQETSKLLNTLGKENHRIAVCGLNPHAGENGLLGFEERAWINPFLKEQSQYYPGLLSYTIPADTAFYRHLKGEFDAVIALYHDQGLGPLKTVEFDTAVHVTMGLPFIRTSPDHGTAFDIAGKGIASARSMHNAIALAQKLVKKEMRKKVIFKKHENDKS